MYPPTDSEDIGALRSPNTWSYLRKARGEQRIQNLDSLWNVRKALSVWLFAVVLETISDLQDHHSRLEDCESPIAC